MVYPEPVESDGSDEIGFQMELVDHGWGILASSRDIAHS